MNFRREEMKHTGGDVFNLGTGDSKNRREVGIKIHVGDFS